jgi:hypothetical protein
MRSTLRIVSSAALAACLAGIAGCEWGGGDSFNTSSGAGATVNMSGVYTGRSGDLVAGRPISRLLLTQTGNALQVQDNNNVWYEGSVGSAGVVATPNETTHAYPAGALLMEAQVNFSSDTASFVGVVRSIAVSDIQGVTSTHGTNVVGTTTITITAPPVTITTTTTTTDGDTYTTTYTVTESDTQLILEGNWTEGGGVYAVNGMARPVY